MRIGFVVFEGMTALDFVGAYDPLTRLGTMGFREDVSWEICGRRERVRAGAGVEIGVDVVSRPLDRYDLLVVPGGFATRDLVEDEGFLGWLETADVDLLSSVCTGSLLLGAAGFLAGRRATTHPSAYDDLAEYCTVVRERVVDEGDLITAGGVTSGLDLGLALVERIDGAETRETVAAQMDYPY